MTEAAKSTTPAPLVLTGNEGNEPQELSEAEVNHLRRLLAWIRLEHNLGEEMMIGILHGAQMCVESDPSLRERAQQVVDSHIEKAARVPKYIRQAVKMLTKAVHDHDAETRIIDVKGSHDD